MPIEPHILRRIERNAILSVLLYSLPVLLMFFVLYVRGERPWETPPTAVLSGGVIHALNQLSNFGIAALMVSLLLPRWVRSRG